MDPTKLKFNTKHYLYLFQVRNDGHRHVIVTFYSLVYIPLLMIKMYFCVRGYIHLVILLHGVGFHLLKTLWRPLDVWSCLVISEIGFCCLLGITAHFYFAGSYRVHGVGFPPVEDLAGTPTCMFLFGLFQR